MLPATRPLAASITSPLHRPIISHGASVRAWLMSLVLALLLIQAIPALAASGDAQLLMVTGDVRVLRSTRDWTSMRPLSRGDTLQSGDTVVTGDDGRAQLRFSDGALVTLQPRSRFRIDEYRFDADGQRGFFSLLRGALRTTTGTIGKRSHDDYQLRTPTATVGVRGTDFEVEHTECDPRCSPGSRAGLRVMVHEGRVVVTTRTGTIELPAGSGVQADPIDAVLRPFTTRPASAPAAKPSAAPGSGAPSTAAPNSHALPAPGQPSPAAPAAPAPAPFAPVPATPPAPPTPPTPPTPPDYLRPGTEAMLPGWMPLARSDAWPVSADSSKSPGR